MGLTKKQYVYLALSGLAALLMLRTCSRDTQTEMAAASAAQPAPVVVQNPAPVAVHDSDNSGFFTGLLMGHMMSGNHGYSHHTTVVNHYSAPRYSAPRYYRSRTVTTYRATRRYYGRRR